MTALQASLLCKHSSLSHFYHSKHLQLSLSNNRRSSSFYLFTLDDDSTSVKSRFRRHRLVFSCTLHPENVNSSPESKISDNDWISDLGESRANEISGENKRIEGGDLPSIGSEVERELRSDNSLGKGDSKSRLPVVVFLMGLVAAAKRLLEKVLLSDWFNWWPFWRQEKRLEMLAAEADANPKDATKQSALLAELNQHSPEAVITRFEQRDHAVDSRGVSEYIRALVATNAIAEYLPDELSGKPSSLPTLLEELKQRASGNIDEPFLSPGISEKQPLHVMMVDPKVPNRSSRFAQELISTILFTVAVGLVWLLGAAALQKYISSLGGIGTSGMGSSSSYSPKELNKEIMPEKNVKTFKDVKGCDDAKQELEEVVEYLKNPTKFTRLGGKLPKGILLTGAPGTGKTLLAKAIAGEAGVPFFYRAGSEFEEMFVGVGARRVRSLFQAAKKKVYVQTAVVAKEALEGHCIYDGGFCKLHISYSRHTDLSIKVNNDRSRDYTIPNAPMLNVQPSILGHQPLSMGGPGSHHQYNGPQFPQAPEGLAAPQHSAGWGTVPHQSMPVQMMHSNHPYMRPPTMTPDMAPGMMQLHSQNGLRHTMPPYHHPQ